MSTRERRRTAMRNPKGVELFNRRAFLSLAALSLYPINAQAYILPAYGIIRETKGKLIGSKNLKIRLETQVWNPQDRGLKTLSEQWDFANPIHFQLIRKSTEAPDAMAETIASQAPYRPDSNVQKVLLGLFGHQGLESVIDHFRIDTKKRRLALLNESPMFVLGSKNHQSSAPEIWIDKENWHIRRVKFNTLAGVYDLRLSDWSTPVTRGLFPSELTVKFNHRPIRLSKTKKVEISKERMNRD